MQQKKKKNFKLFVLEIHFETTVIIILVSNCISKTIFFKNELLNSFRVYYLYNKVNPSR